MVALLTFKAQHGLAHTYIYVNSYSAPIYKSMSTQGTRFDVIQHNCEDYNALECLLSSVCSHCRMSVFGDRKSFPSPMTLHRKVTSADWRVYIVIAKESLASEIISYYMVK